MNRERYRFEFTDDDEAFRVVCQETGGYTEWLHLEAAYDAEGGQLEAEEIVAEQGLHFEESTDDEDWRESCLTPQERQR